MLGNKSRDLSSLSPMLFRAQDSTEVVKVQRSKLTSLVFDTVHLTSFRCWSIWSATCGGMLKLRASSLCSSTRCGGQFSAVDSTSSR